MINSIRKNGLFSWWLQRILSMGPVLALAVGLCACGGSGAGREGNGGLPVNSGADQAGGRAKSGEQAVI